jgi:glycerophosphoryl diester phosphodiesterase
MMHPLDWLTARPIAHRGLHDQAKGIIENTASAFAAAIAGHYAIECDVQISADGEAVVFHDEDVSRLTESNGLVRAQTSQELQKITIKNTSDKIQTLAALLDQVDGAVPLVIELKSHWDGDIALALRALEVLENYKGHYCLMSFDQDLVAAVAEYAPETIRGITADRTVHADYDLLPPERKLDMQQFRHIEKTRPHFVSFYFRDLPYAPVQKLRDAGLKIITWTIRNKEEESLALQHSDQVTFEGYAA